MTDRASRPFVPWRFHALGETWLLECRASRAGDAVGPALSLAQPKGSDRAVLSERQLDALAATLRDPSLFIFHVSHCGSTLLARLLAADPRLRVCIEPDYLGRFFARTSGWPDDRFARAARTMIRACASGLPDGQRLVIKFASHALHRMAQVRACFPRVPAILVYREPAAVAAGSMAASWGFLSRRPRWLADLLGLGDRADEMTDEALRIAYLERLFALSVANGPVFDRVINYTEIPAVLDDIRYGLLGLPARDISGAVRDAIARDSKAPGRSFVPIQRPGAASKPISSAMTDHYEALELRRLSRRRASA